MAACNLTITVIVALRDEEHALHFEHNSVHEPLVAAIDRLCQFLDFMVEREMAKTRNDNAPLAERVVIINLAFTLSTTVYSRSAIAPLELNESDEFSASSPFDVKAVMWERNDKLGDIATVAKPAVSTDANDGFLRRFFRQRYATTWLSRYNVDRTNDLRFAFVFTDTDASSANNSATTEDLSPSMPAFDAEPNDEPTPKKQKTATDEEWPRILDEEEEEEREVSPDIVWLKDVTSEKFESIWAPRAEQLPYDPEDPIPGPRYEAPADGDDDVSVSNESTITVVSSVSGSSVYSTERRANVGAFSPDKAPVKWIVDPVTSADSDANAFILADNVSSYAVYRR